MSVGVISGWSVVAGPEAEALDVREELGRKGTSAFDRCTTLAVVACGRALRSSPVVVDDGRRDRIGVVLGTTAGSVRSAVDFTVDTLVEERPYYVNPSHFPNTVMNAAAGRSAIWYGLRGTNATVAGGPVAFLSALKYAGNALRGRHVDTVLVGAVEEMTAHAAGVARAAGCERFTEGAAIFVMHAPGSAPDEDMSAEVLSVAAGFSTDDAAGALAGCVRRALADASVDPADVAYVADGARPDDRPGSMAAAAAMDLAAVLDLHRSGVLPDGAPSVICGQSAEGAVVAAVVRGWDRGRRDRS